MMVKLVILQIVASIGILLSIDASLINHPITWYELGIVEQIRLFTGISFMICVALAAIFIFRSIWIKNGYAGADLILVDKEVALFMSHVLAFILVEVFFFMMLFNKYSPSPEYAYWICGAGFLSPEVVQIMHFIMDRIKSIKKSKED